jgi:hypothetical protein
MQNRCVKVSLWTNLSFLTTIIKISKVLYWMKEVQTVDSSSSGLLILTRAYVSRWIDIIFIYARKKLQIFGDMMNCNYEALGFFFAVRGFMTQCRTSNTGHRLFEFRSKRGPNILVQWCTRRKLASQTVVSRCLTDQSVSRGRSYGAIRRTYVRHLWRRPVLIACTAYGITLPSVIPTTSPFPVCQYTVCFHRLLRSATFFNNALAPSIDALPAGCSRCLG